MNGRALERAGGAPGGPARDAVRGWVSPRLRTALGGAAAPEQEPEALLERLFRHEPERFLRRMPGRETFAWSAAPPSGRGGEDRLDAGGGGGAAAELLVCKRLRGDESRDWWYERLRLRPPRSAARRECENLLGLRDAGIPVPEPLGWVEERRALRVPVGAGPSPRGGRSAVLMERVPHEVDLIELLEGARRSERDHWLEVLAALVARLHDAGWYHRDLYLGHLVLAPRAGGPGLVLLDVGRARRERAPRRRWLVKDLAALLYTTPRAVGRSERLRFLREYVRRRGLEDGDARRSRRARRSWARAVLLKAQLLASHRPRHVHPPSEIDRRARGPAARDASGGGS